MWGDKPPRTGSWRWLASISAFFLHFQGCWSIIRFTKMDLIYIVPLNSPYENYNGATATTLPWNPDGWTNLFFVAGSLLYELNISWQFLDRGWINGATGVCLKPSSLRPCLWRGWGCDLGCPEDRGQEVYKNQQTSSRGVVWNEMST